MAQATVEVLNAAERYAKGMQDDYVSTEHILLGLADSIEGKRLSSYGLTKEAILSALWCAPTYNEHSARIAGSISC
jgi:ATP-dependent Clp protease ATP-binding subunit ClpB